MVTLFFDIDGTLVDAGGAGLRAIDTVIKRNIGLTIPKDIELAGRTDFGIWTVIFAALKVDFPTNYLELLDEYCDELTKSLRGSCILLPGIRALLEQLDKSQEINLGLLTGNAKRAAEIKLQSVGVDHFFGGVGGFGDLDRSRNSVAQKAVLAANSQFEVFNPEKIWVIGDTVHDVTCGHHVGAKVLTVATGGASRETLLNSGADYVLENLAETIEVLKILQRLTS